MVLSAIATDVGTLEHFPGMNLVRSAALVVQMYAFVPHRILILVFCIKNYLGRTYPSSNYLTLTCAMPLTSIPNPFF